MLEIRLFREEDRAAVVALDTREQPPHRRYTAAQWQRWDSQMSGQEVFIRLVAGDPAIAYLQVTDFNTIRRSMPNVCHMHLIVAPEHRRRGIGSALFARALAFARERNAYNLTADIVAHSPDEPGYEFLKKRDFWELERQQPSYLDLATFDLSRFANARKRVEREGVRLLTYADLPDTTEQRRALYDLWIRLEADTPHRYSLRFKQEPFEQWVQNNIEQPEWTPEAVVLAESADRWIGLTTLRFREETNVGDTWLTGVLPEYRGRGIATALKLRAMEAAKERGCPVITTGNQQDNAPMLAINRKLGFVAEPPLVLYITELR
jgi:mycothiol synthase